MNYSMQILNDGKVIASRDVSIDTAVELLAGMVNAIQAKSAQQSANARGAGRPRKHEEPGNEKWRALDDQPQRSAVKRFRLTDDERLEIERMLLDKIEVPAIMEKIAGKIDVSPATVYMIKTRLKKERRL